MSNKSTFFIPQENTQQGSVRQENVPSDQIADSFEEIADIFEEFANYLNHTQRSVEGVASLASRKGDSQKEGAMIEASDILAPIADSLFAKDEELKLVKEKLRVASFTSKEVQANNNSEPEASYSTPVPAA